MTVNGDMTLIDLCNNALDLVGASSIDSLDEGSPESRLVNRLHGQVIDAVLRAYPWNSAQMRQVLEPLQVAPSWGYSTAFALPEAPDYCLRVLEVGKPEQTIDWRIESLYDGGANKRIIACNQTASLPILFIRRLTDPALMDPLLVDVMAAELAMRLAAKLTESATRIERLSALTRARYRSAIGVDAREQGTASYTDPADWLGARGQHNMSQGGASWLA